MRPFKTPRSRIAVGVDMVKRPYCYYPSVKQSLKVKVNLQLLTFQCEFKKKKTSRNDERKTKK